MRSTASAHVFFYSELLLRCPLVRTVQPPTPTSLQIKPQSFRKQNHDVKTKARRLHTCELFCGAIFTSYGGVVETCPTRRIRSQPPRRSSVLSTFSLRSACLSCLLTHLTSNVEHHNDAATRLLKVKQRTTTILLKGFEFSALRRTGQSVDSTR
jgi:hypothetical protein